MTAHKCHAKGCETEVAPTSLMCGKHWAMVPGKIKFKVIQHYRKGQCDDKRPSKEWAMAARDAINEVWKKELELLKQPCCFAPKPYHKMDCAKGQEK